MDVFVGMALSAARPVGRRGNSGVVATVSCA